jgi:hypothetical protein
MAANGTMSQFSTILADFCSELEGTFPELSVQIQRARNITPATFWSNWMSTLDILIHSDESLLFSERKGFILSAVRLNQTVWSEISEQTKTAIWKYLRKLTLESSVAIGLDGLGLSSDNMKKLMDLALVEKDFDSTFKNLSETFSPFLENLKSRMGMGMDGGEPNFDFSDLSGFTIPDIPAHLRTGVIATLAESLAKQFDPAEFGIDPELLKSSNSNNIDEVIKTLMNLFKSNPDLLMNGAKRLTERIKAQILGGTLKRDEIISEAKEFYAIFKEHPSIKGILSKILGSGGSSGGSAGGILELVKGMFGLSGDSDDEDETDKKGGGGPSESDRLRAVKERLRKKMSAKTAKK